ADVGWRRRRIEIPPALEGPVRHEARRHQSGLVDDGAAGQAVLVGARPQIEDPLAHAHIALDDPVERTAVEHLVAALRHHAGRMEEFRLLPRLALFGELLHLPVAQIVDGVAADAELDQMQRHAEAVSWRLRLPASASATFEAGWRPSALQM